MTGLNVFPLYFSSVKGDQPVSGVTSTLFIFGQLMFPSVYFGHVTYCTNKLYRVEEVIIIGSV